MADSMQVETKSRSHGAACPDCGTVSHRLHSHYIRKLADMPAHGRRVSLSMTVRRFRRTDKGCRRRTFVEPLGGFAAPYARQTSRLTDLHFDVACALGGSASARMATRLCCPVSADTLIRRIVRMVPITERHETPRVLGVDDWAWRRGHHYGTILVDLERNKVVDLLAARQGSTLAAWLRDHPGIESVARDRAGAYADGIRQGTPAAIQVADRWHLIRNLHDAFLTVVDRHTALARRIMADITSEVSPVEQTIDAEMVCDPGEAGPVASSHARHGEREEQYRQAVAMRAKGQTISCIARTIGAERKTVRRWLRQGHPSTWQRRIFRPGIMTPYAAYLDQRLKDGCHNAACLHREITAMGFSGRYGSVRDWIVSRRSTAGAFHPVPVKPAPMGRNLAWMLTTESDNRSEKDVLFIQRLMTAAPILAQATAWVRNMQDLFTKKTQASLEKLLEEGKKTPLSRFVNGLRRDLSAVQAALHTPWTTSPVEGQISRLKMIKRTMFGRAGFKLLRARVLHAKCG
ncbi:ISL3 family transposase [Acidomonas methanolica]|uniref:ISL3 family transposase n=1 Tax=Acidomonas methanolica TaxID=437 RepID=UPI000AC53646|nr:ISL3 family transposase [Acidomonas methanolica]